MEIKCLIAILALIALVHAQDTDEGSFSIRHSFTPPYDKGHQIPFWDAGAGAYVNRSFVRLTPARQSRTGYLWNTIPSTMVDWQAEIEFLSNGLKHYGGDGFAFWYAEQRALLGGVFGSADYWNGLAVIFDSYNNDGQGPSPIILAIDNDGTQSYDGSTDGTTQALGSCSFPFRNIKEPGKARITYKNGQLDVKVAFSSGEGTPTWSDCFKIENLELGVDKYFGLTAHTGDVADSHDIFSLKVKDLSPSNVDLDVVRQRYREKIEHDHSLPMHEELQPKDFQHSVLTMLHQSQQALNILELSQIAIGDALQDIRDDVDSVAKAAASEDSAAPAAPPAGEPMPRAAASSDSQLPVESLVTKTDIQQIVKKLDELPSISDLDRREKDIRSPGPGSTRELNNIKTQLNAIKRSISDLQSSLSLARTSIEESEGGSGESWLAFLLLLLIAGCSLFQLIISLQDRSNRRHKLP